MTFRAGRHNGLPLRRQKTAEGRPEMLRPAAKLLGILTAVTLSAGAAAAPENEGDLAAAAQNPVADLISLPLQNNTLFGVGPDDDVANVLNIQPVIPINIGDWNLINRTIAPVIYLPDFTRGLESLPEGVSRGDAFGLGDINHSVYVSPARPGDIIWGIGPSVTFPTATDKKLGSEKWSAGPAAVALITPAPWVAGEALEAGAPGEGALGGRRPRAPAVVLRRRRRPPRRQSVAGAAFRQLQPPGRLVPGLGADHHGKLE